MMAYVALGSNLGDSRSIVLQAMDRLQEFSEEPLVRSSLWRTEPIDCPPGSPAFINAAVALKPVATETPESLLARLQRLEREFGRRPKTIQNEPRPLDLDLIAFGSETRHTPQLELPHPRAHQRCFVLAPMSEIAPSLVLPFQSKSIRELFDDLENVSEEKGQAGCSKEVFRE